MSRLGKRLIKALQAFHDDLKSDKPMEQHIVRRMKVKGKTVYIHDRFVAPLRPPAAPGTGKEQP